MQKITPDLAGAPVRVREAAATLATQAREKTGGMLEVAIGKLLIFERAKRVPVGAGQESEIEVRRFIEFED